MFERGVTDRRFLGNDMFSYEHRVARCPESSGLTHTGTRSTSDSS